MYTWGYIKEASLAKLDMSADQAIEMGLLNKFPFYANEAMTQILGIKPKRTFAVFNVKRELDVIATCKRIYELDDVSFLVKGPRAEEDLSLNQSKALKYYNEFTYVNKPVTMPKDFYSWNDDRSYIDRGQGLVEASDGEYNLYGANKVIFFATGAFHLPYNATWFTFTSNMNDDVVIDVPGDIVECLPAYIVSQCYKIDDETKSSLYRNEFEMAMARLDENDVHVGRAMKIGGNW